MNSYQQDGARSVAKAGRSMAIFGDLIMSFGTIFAFYFGSQMLLAKADPLPQFMYWLVPSLVGLAGYYAIDSGKDTVTGYVFSRLFRKWSKNKHQDSHDLPWLFQIIAGLAMVVMVGASLSGNLVITPQIAASVTDDKGDEVAGLAGIASSETQVYSADRAVYEQGLRDAKAALAEAQNNRQNALKGQGQSAEMRRLLASGNAWAIQQVERTHSRKIANAQRKVDEAGKVLAGFIASRGQSTAATTATVATQIGATQASVAATMGRWSGFISLIMGLGVVMFLLGKALEVMYTCATGDEIAPDVSLGKVAGKATGKAYYTPLRFFDRLLGNDDPGQMKFAHAGGGGAMAATLPRSSSNPFADILATSSRASVTREERRKACADSVCKTDRKTEQTETQKDRTETRTERTESHTEAETESDGGVGEELLPDLNNADQMKRYIKKVRGWASYEPTRAKNLGKIEAATKFLRANGYSVRTNPDGLSLTITKLAPQADKATFEWEVNEGAEVDSDVHNLAASQSKEATPRAYPDYGIQPENAQAAAFAYSPLNLSADRLAELRSQREQSSDNA